LDVEAISDQSPEAAVYGVKRVSCREHTSRNVISTLKFLNTLSDRWLDLMRLTGFRQLL